jgi:hypothetical protein
MSCRTRAIVMLAWGLMSASPSLAHLGQDQFGRFPFVDAGDVVGGGTSWGVVLPDDVFGGYARVCEESFGPNVSFALSQPARGRVLLGGLRGVEATTDGGCTYAVLPNALEGLFPSSLWEDPADPNHLVVTTATTSADNGVWRSRDGGDTWSIVVPPRPGSFFSVAASPGGEYMGVGGSVVEAIAGGGLNTRVLLFVSVDGGETFVDVSNDVAERVIATPLVWDDSALLVGGLDQTTQGFVDRLVLEDGRAVITPLGVTPRQTTHAVVFGEELLVIARNGARGELYRANGSALGFGVVPGGPSECLVDEGDRLLGCGKQAGLNTALFLTSDDGLTWTEAISFLDVHYRACPEGSVGQTACSAFIESFCGDDTDDDFDGSRDCEDDDCAFNPLCRGTPEGEGESEGDGTGGNASQTPPEGTAASCCRGDHTSAWLGGIVLFRRRRRR